MAQSPLESVIRNWGTRAVQAQQAGLPVSTYRELARHDIQNVMKGGTAIPNLQANLGIIAAAVKHPIIQEPKRHTGILGVLGNIPGDIGSIVKNFIPGLARYVYHLPSETHNTIRAFTDPEYAKQQGYEQSDFSASGLAAGARNVAKLPLLQIVPGFHTIASSTTSEGRKELQRHPVGTALDVMPFAVGSAEAAALGRPAEIGSTVEALQQGKVFRAGARALPAAKETIQSALTEGLEGSSKFSKRTGFSAKLHDTAMNLGISPELANRLSRPWTQISRRMGDKLARHYRDEIYPLVAKMPPEERALLHEESTRPDLHPSPEPHHAAIIDAARDLTHAYADEGVAQGGLTRVPVPSGGTEVYSIKSPVSRWFRKARTQAVRHEQALTSLDKFQEQLAERTAKYEAKTGKVRSYNESPEDFAARPAGPRDLNTVHEATRSVTERFRHLDPIRAFPAFAEIVPGMHPSSYAAVFKAIVRLSGENGLFGRFQDALASGDLRTARGLATAIQREFDKPSMSQFSSGQRLSSFMKDIREELKGMSPRMRAHTHAAKMVEFAQRRVDKATAREQFHAQKLAEYQDEFNTQLTNTPSARFEPIIRGLARAGAIEEATRLFQQGQLVREIAPKEYVQVRNLEDAVHEMESAVSFSQFEKYLGSEKWKEIRDDAAKSWTDIAQQPGMDPVWMHNVPAERVKSLFFPRPHTTSYASPREWQNKTFNFAPHVTDIAVALTDAKAQLLRHAGTTEFVNSHVKPWGTTARTKFDEYMKVAGEDTRLNPSVTIPARADQLLRENWIEFDPESFVSMGPASFARPDAFIIPKPVANSLFGRFGLIRDGVLPVNGLWDKTMNMYKFAVLTGPRHIAHVALGGMSFMMMREPRALFRLGKAFRMVKGGEIPEGVSRGLYLRTHPDQVLDISVGKSLARHYLEAPGKGITSVAHKLARFEELVSDTYRTATYLSAAKRGIETEAAIRIANKVFIDLDGMTPVERVLIKQAFPFYAFTKHLFNYLLTYPVDHPIRAAVLARFADQEAEEWNTGLPTQLRYLYFLGQPDDNGNIKTVEWKSINPFRSFANDFTLAGFTASLNPALSGVMQAAGVNVLDAAPELYPDVSYDPESGSLKPKRSNVLEKIAGAYVPQVYALDHFIGLSDGLRRLKESNPGAYRRQLYSALNLPFARSTVNVPYERARTERNRYKGSQLAISAAVRSGNYGEASRYNLAPFRNELMPVSQIQSIVEQVRKQLSAGVAPTAVLPRAGRRRS